MITYASCHDRSLVQCCPQFVGKWWELFDYYGEVPTRTTYIEKKESATRPDRPGAFRKQGGLCKNGILLFVQLARRSLYPSIHPFWFHCWSKSRPMMMLRTSSIIAILHCQSPKAIRSWSAILCSSTITWRGAFTTPAWQLVTLRGRFSCFGPVRRVGSKAKEQGISQTHLAFGNCMMGVRNISERKWKGGFGVKEKGSGG